MCDIVKTPENAGNTEKKTRGKVLNVNSSVMNGKLLKK